MKFLSLCLFLIASILFKESHGFVDVETTKRFEYKLSFKGPHLVFKDGTVPFWQHSGSTICSNDQIRLTPSIRSQKGRIWSTNTMPNDNWEIEVTMRVNGRGRIGADGMAVWYTDRPGTDGPVFGSNDNWNGLGIFLDSFDNDAQQNNPYILVMTNDGTKSYDHHRDGITQQAGGCLRDFRNKPFPIALKIEYYKRVLTIYYHNGLNANDRTYSEICARIENIDLPRNGHFGVSAATGGLADDHDVTEFLTYSLVETNNQNNVPNPEQKKYDEEYAQFLKQLEQEKEKYNQAHPEEHQQEIDEKKNFESESDRQFRTILDVQNSIHQSIRLLDSKFAEVLGRQERIVSMLATGGVPTNQQHQQQVPNQGIAQIDTFNRHEVNQVMNQQNELVRSVRDVLNSVVDVQQKTNFISQNVNKPNQAQQPPQVAQQVPQVQPQQIQAIADDLKNFRFEMNNQMRLNKPQCPDAPSCMSSVFFLTVIVLQSLAFLLYFIIKGRQEAQQKKFY